MDIATYTIYDADSQLAPSNFGHRHTHRKSVLLLTRSAKMSLSGCAKRWFDEALQQVASRSPTLRWWPRGNNIQFTKFTQLELRSVTRLCRHAVLVLRSTLLSAEIQRLSLTPDALRN